MRNQVVFKGVRYKRKLGVNPLNASLFIGSKNSEESQGESCDKRYSIPIF